MREELLRIREGAVFGKLYRSGDLGLDLGIYLSLQIRGKPLT